MCPIAEYLSPKICFKNLILGQFPQPKTTSEEISINNEEWKFAVVRFFYITFQIASTYFVFLIVLLRLIVIYNPMMMMSIERKTTKLMTALAWGMALILNLLPIIASAGFDENTEREDKAWYHLSYIIQIHVGITLPLLL